MSNLERDLRQEIIRLEADLDRERAARRIADQALADAIRERDEARRRMERMRAAL